MINPGSAVRGCDSLVTHHRTAHRTQQPHQTRRIVAVSGTDHQYVGRAARTEVGARPAYSTAGQPSARVAAISSEGAARSCRSSPWPSNRVAKRQTFSEPCRAARQTMSESLEEVKPGLSNVPMVQPD